ncbi:hypothetical protein CYMTET_5733 [Cymbomonas tetramitiformis]|uniref:Uncharacterized protein n=1 Tax=Cymbomonas tetramitiformis TaxID=36881 RepID=A0AAE0LIS6_9CHLO|nr:hypothetical protein CYMTET_5733 [Cymbomonas tetramitiformis]
MSADRPSLGSRLRASRSGVGTSPATTPPTSPTGDGRSDPIVRMSSLRQRPTSRAATSAEFHADSSVWVSTPVRASQRAEFADKLDYAFAYGEELAKLLNISAGLYIRQLHPAFSGQQEQEVLIEILRASRDTAEHLFNIPMYFEVIRTYEEDNRLTASGYPGGLQKFIEAIGKVWYTQGSAHHSQLPGSSSRPRAASMTGEVREGGRGSADKPKPKEKHPGGRGGKGGKGGKDTHPRATTPPPSRPRSPLRGGTRADFFEHEKALYKAAKLKHAGSTNKDSTPSGTWNGLKFTPSDPNDKSIGHPCRSCKFKHGKTVTHSLGSFQADQEFEDTEWPALTSKPRIPQISGSSPHPPPSASVNHFSPNPFSSLSPSASPPDTQFSFPQLEPPALFAFRYFDTVTATDLREDPDHEDPAWEKTKRQRKRDKEKQKKARQQQQKLDRQHQVAESLASANSTATAPVQTDITVDCNTQCPVSYLTDLLTGTTSVASDISEDTLDTATTPPTSTTPLPPPSSPPDCHQPEPRATDLVHTAAVHTAAPQPGCNTPSVTRTLVAIAMHWFSFHVAVLLTLLHITLTYTFYMSPRPATTFSQPASASASASANASTQPASGGATAPATASPQPTSGGATAPATASTQPASGGATAPATASPQPAPGGATAPATASPQPTSGGLAAPATASPQAASASATAPANHTPHLPSGGVTAAPTTLCEPAAASTPPLGHSADEALVGTPTDHTVYTDGATAADTPTSLSTALEADTTVASEANRLHSTHTCSPPVPSTVQACAVTPDFHFPPIPESQEDTSETTTKWKQFMADTSIRTDTPRPRPNSSHSPEHSQWDFSVMPSPSFHQLNQFLENYSRTHPSYCTEDPEEDWAQFEVFDDHHLGPRDQH